VIFKRPNLRIATVARIALLVAGLSLVILAGTSQAARVAAPKLLPKDTYFYLQVANVPELQKAFKETNFGRMIADPEIKPFLEKLYASASQFLDQFEERTGYSIEEIGSIPKGEIAVAAMPMEGNNFGVVVILDCGDAATTKKLTDKLYQLSEDATGAPQEEKVDGVTLYINPAAGPVRPVFFEHDSAVVITSGIDTAKQLLKRWNEGSEDSLADNSRFKAIMNRCRGTKDEAPQISLFVDPMEFLGEASKQNPTLQFGMRMLPALGLDGLKGLGASMVLATEEFDSIVHAHLLLDNPRSGVLELLALDSGDDTPPTWVPEDIATYSSWHANIKDAFTKGAKLADTFRFQEEGMTANRLNDRVKDFLGVDLTNDILPSITGRLVHVNRFAEPARVGVGPRNVYAIELRDPKEFQRIYDKLLDQVGSRFEKKGYGGVNYYRQTTERDIDDVPMLFCFTQMNNWLLIADHPSIMEFILNGRDSTEERLAAAIDFKLIAGKIARQPGGERPAMMSFERPENSLKYFYDLGASERTRDRLRDQADSNPFFKALNEGLTDNPMPPWSALSKYLAPQGSMIVNDDSGVHYMQFSLRRK
jgi:hypothetical protein